MEQNNNAKQKAHPGREKLYFRDTMDEPLPGAYGGNNILSRATEVSVMIDVSALVIVVGLYPQNSQELISVLRARSFTQRFILSSPDPYNAFSEMCQRVLLVRNWLDQNQRFKLPADMRKFLDHRNPYGVIASQRWFQKMQLRRRKEPLYLFNMKTFPEAVLEMATEPNREIFGYWYQWFLEHEADETFLLAQSVCTRYFFGRHDFGGKVFWIPKPGTTGKLKHVS